MNSLGSFSRCMTETDSQSAASARWLRGKSMAVSLAIEAAAVGTLLLVPLLSTGVLPPLLISTPTPPYRGEPQPVRRATPSLNSPQRTLAFHAAAARPVFSRLDADSAPPTMGVASENQPGPTVPQPGILTGKATAPPSAWRLRQAPLAVGLCRKAKV